MPFGKVFNVNVLAVKELMRAPTEAVHPLIATPRAVAFVHVPIVFQGAIVELALTLKMQHEPAGRIPTVHPDRAERQWVDYASVVEHLLNRVQFAFAIAVFVKDAIVNQPKLLPIGVAIDAGDDAAAMPKPLDIIANKPF